MQRGLKEFGKPFGLPASLVYYGTPVHHINEPPRDGSAKGPSREPKSYDRSLAQSGGYIQRIRDSSGQELTK